VESSDSAVSSEGFGVRCGSPPGWGEHCRALDRRKEKGDPRESHTGNPKPGGGVGAGRDQAQGETKPAVFVCASAVGFYGNRGDELLREESPGGQGFLSEVCREWEDASRIAAEAGIRTVNIRIGLVLSAKGGALRSMLTPFKLGLGGRIGSGQQWWSWIHVDDIVRGIHHVIRTESLSGPVNLVAPNPLRNAEFTKVLASVLGRPAFFPVPEFALRLAFGEMAADELLLASQRVEPGKLTASGYTFRFRELRAALENLM